MACHVYDAGFNHMQACSLKGKHVDALRNQWQVQGGATSPLKNLQLGIPECRHNTNQSKAQSLDELLRLESIRDPYVQMSLHLKPAFGLRRQECIKLQPAWADLIALKSSWTKGGKPEQHARPAPSVRTGPPDHQP